MCDALAVAHPRESASSYLFSQSLAASRCNLHATSRPSHSRRSLPCHFLLCRFVLFCLVLRRRRLPVPCSRGFWILIKEKARRSFFLRMPPNIIDGGNAGELNTSTSNAHMLRLDEEVLAALEGFTLSAVDKRNTDLTLEEEVAAALEEEVAGRCIVAPLESTCATRRVARCEEAVGSEPLADGSIS